MTSSSSPDTTSLLTLSLSPQMGCGGSKLDDLPVVALCRDRHRLLAAAIQHRHALAVSHAAYSRSLLSLAAALRPFLQPEAKPKPQPENESDSEDPISPFHSTGGAGSSPVADELHLHYARRKPQSSDTFFANDPSAASVAYSSCSDYPNPQYPYPYIPPPYNYLDFSAAVPPAAAAAPPSPPRSTGWEFLNPFEPYENFYASYNTAAGYSGYSPSRSSREVREEEGIPDLEDDVDDACAEIDKVCLDPRPQCFSPPPNESPARDAGSGDLKKPSRPCGGGGGDAVAFGAPSIGGGGGVSEVMQVITAQFDRASESAGQVALILEVGRLPNHEKTVSTKMEDGVVLPPFTCYSSELLDFQVREMGTGNLSSTLQKLYMWEKLYNEVRAEEKTRILHDRYCRRLRRLDKSGAEAPKVDLTRAKIRKLSTKIRVAEQVVHRISNTINKLRNEELWPQICQVIQGITRMWREMLECHHTQSLAIAEATNLKRSLPFGAPTDLNLEATKELEVELLHWISNFSTWINAQKSYVKALHTWLSRCFNSNPDATKSTPDRRPVSSSSCPAKLGPGTPPVFVICSDWSDTVGRVSETVVVDAMHAFAADVLHLWEQRQRSLLANVVSVETVEDQMKTLEMDEMRVRRAVNKKKQSEVVGQTSHVACGEVVHKKKRASMGGAAGSGGDVAGLQASLRGIFEAMEEFAASSLQAYEELCIRSDELRLAKSNAKVP